MPALTPEQARSTFPASPGAADGVFSNRPGSLTGVLVMTAGPTDGVSGVSSTVLDQSTTVQNVLPFDANVGGYLLGRSGSHLRQLPFSLFGRALLTAGTSQTGRELLQLGSLALASPTGTADASTFLRGDGTWQPLSGIVTTDASLLTSGTLADARLSANVPLKNAANVFTAGQTITGVLNLNDQYNAAIVQANGTQVFRSLVAAGPWVDTPTTTYFQVGVVGGNICFSGGSVSASRLAFVADATVFGVNNSSIPAPSSGDVVTIRTDNAGYRALKLQGVSSQTGNLMELWGVSSTSTQRVQAAINSGWADSTDATRTGQLSLGAYYTGTLQEGLRITANSYGPVVTCGYATITSNFGTFAINTSGSYFSVLTGTGASMTLLPYGDFTVTPGNAYYRAAVFKGAASQSANLTEWQDSAGSVRLAARIGGDNEATSGVLLRPGGSQSIEFSPTYGAYLNGGWVVRGNLNVANYGAMYVAAGDGSLAYSTKFVSHPSSSSLHLQNAASQTADTLQLWGVSSTSTQRVQAAINSGWADSTDATRRGHLTLSAYQQATKVDGVRVGVEATYGTPRTRVFGELEVMCQSYWASQADAHQYYFRFQQFRGGPHGISLDTYDTYDDSFKRRVLSASDQYLAIGGDVLASDWAMCLVNSNTLMNALGQGRFSFGESTSGNSNWLQVYHGSTFGAADTFTVATQRYTDSTVANNPELVFRSRQFSFYTGSAYNTAGLRTLLVKSDNTVLWGNAGVLLFDQLETAPRISGLRTIQNNENSILIGGSIASVTVSNAGWTQVENAASCDTDATLKLQYRGTQLAPLLQVVPATTTPDLVKLCNNAGTAKLTVTGEGFTYGGGHMIRWPNVTTGDKAGLDWWRGGSFGVRMRVDPDSADLNIYDTGSGSEVLRFGLNSAMTNIASGKLVLGHLLSTYARLQANRYTGSAVEAFRLETFEAGEMAARLALWATASVGDQAKMQVRRSDLYFQRDSSTTADQDVAGILPAWADSTHATRTGQVSIGAYYTGTLQEGLRIVAQSGGTAKVVVTPQSWPASYATFNRNSSTAFDIADEFSTYYFRVLQSAYSWGGYNTGAKVVFGTMYTDGSIVIGAASPPGVGGVTGQIKFPVNDSGGATTDAARIVAVVTDDTYLTGKAKVQVYAGHNTLAATLDDGAATFNGTVKTLSTTVASLPSAATAGAGARAFVTDATATTFASAVTGGGANAVPVYSDGAAWYIG